MSSLGGVNGTVYSLAILGDSLFLGGHFSTYRGSPTPTGKLAKIALSNGALDTTFNTAISPGPDNAVLTILAVPCSGTNCTYTQNSAPGLYVGGYFKNYKGGTSGYPYLVKLDPGNATLLTTYFQATDLPNTNQYVQALAINGSSLYVGGNFTTYRSATANYLAKIDTPSTGTAPTTGTLDTTFTQSIGANGAVFALSIYNSQLYLGGAFSQYRSPTNPSSLTTAERLIRVDLNSGILDASFITSGFSAPVYALTIDSTGYLYAGGSFTTYKGAIAQRLAKISPSGSLDFTFTQTQGLNATPLALATSPSGLSIIYVGGEFTSYRGLELENTTPYCIAVDPNSGDRSAF
jgi:hypothetical protein